MDPTTTIGGDPTLIPPPVTPPTVFPVDDSPRFVQGQVINGTSGPDTLTGTHGDDTIDGGVSPDRIDARDGNDTILWSPGGGSDTIDGGRGVDTLRFTHANISEVIGVSAGVSGHAVVTRDIAAINMDLDNVERIAFASAGGGTDRFTVGDLTGTDVKQVAVDFGAADGLADMVTVAGRGGNDAITLETVNGVTAVNGLAATVLVSNAEAADRLVVQGGLGADTLDASALAGGAVVNFDGGDGADVLALRGGAVGDTISLSAGSQTTPEGAPVFFEVNGAAGQVNLTAVETVVIDAGAGDDRVAANSYNGPTPLLVNAGDGADTVFGGSGADTLNGGRGADVIDGGLQRDVINGGDGDDRIAWNPGGGSDTIDGGAGTDTVTLNTANIGETLGLSAAAGHAILTRDIASITLDLDNVEKVVFGGGGGGVDRYMIGDLRGADVRQVEVDLGATPDAADDFVQVSATENADVLSVAAANGVTTLKGLTATVSVTHNEADDRMVVFGGLGGDTLEAAGLAGGMVVNFDGGDGADLLAFKGGSGGDTIQLFGGSLTAEGQPVFAEIGGVASRLNLLSVETILVDTGAGDDTIRASGYVGVPLVAINAGDGADNVFGSAGTDTVNGGRGGDTIDGGQQADVILGGDGDDKISWNPGGGSDTVDGGAGTDTLAFNTANIGELITLTGAADGHLQLTRSVASIVMDVDNVERIAFGGGPGGPDKFYLAGLEGTDVRVVDIALGNAAGGDGQPDSVLTNGTAERDRVVISGADGAAVVKGLPAEIHVDGGDAGDWLAINTLDGVDTLDASAFAAGPLGLRLNGGGGADRFVFGPAKGGIVEIIDFQAHSQSGEADVIQLKGFADHTFAQAVAAGHIAQAGADVLIDDHDGAVIRLTNVTLGTLGSGDFIFS